MLRWLLANISDVIHWFKWIVFVVRFCERFLMSTTVTKRANGTRRVQTVPEGDSRVEQHHRDRVNIVSIMERARKTGFMRQRIDQPRYGDFTSFEDFHDTQNRVLAAQAEFMTLPAKVRRRFDHDIGKMLDFIEDPENLQEAVELGLIADPNPPAPPVAIGTPVAPVAPEEPAEPSPETP